MAIKISGTTVIDDSRNLTNVNNVTGAQYILSNNFVENLYAYGNTGSTPNLTLSSGSFITATLSANATFTFTTTSLPASDAIYFTLFLTNDGTASRTITWPASVKWPNNSVPVRTTTANKTDVYTFFSYDGGTNWYGALSLYNYS